MSISQLLHSMCAELPDADLNAIRKARGFSAKETASRTSFASFYVTSIGVAEVMAALTPEEAFTLRLLHETGEADTSFFGRLYEIGNPYGTYSQRYKPVFEAVKRNLVRRGLVVMAEVKVRAETVQLERWRFALPPEFVPFLPALPAVPNDGAGQTDDRTIRKKLLQLIGGGPAVPNDPLPLELKHGSLYLRELPFSLATFSLWQMDAWARALKTYKPNLPASFAPTEAALKLLSAETWTRPAALDPALKIYCFGGQIPSAEKLLHQGWELGLFARLELGSVHHYRLAQAALPASFTAPYPPALAWAGTSSRAGAVKVDLRLIPLHDLDQLNTLAHLTIEDGVLYASPSLVKLGRATPAQRHSPLAQWLADQIPAFGQAAETVEAQWGKTLLHENLLVARVRDLSLRVQLERELKENLLVLSEHFVAFPLEARSSVEKVLKKTGFVTKIVKA